MFIRFQYILTCWHESLISNPLEVTSVPPSVLSVFAILWSCLPITYPAQAVKKIEMNKNEYEVELANGLDLTFNKHFQVIDIDWWDNSILTDCFQKVHPKKCDDLHLMSPTNFPIPRRTRMVSGDFLIL